MTRAENEQNGLRRRGILRREFLKLTASAGLLAGCQSLEKTVTTGLPSPDATPTHSPVPTPTVASTQVPAASATTAATATTAASSTSTAMPAATPTAVPSATSTAAPTSAPTATLTTTPSSALSAVVRTHHNGVWGGNALVSDVLRGMLDASLRALTGLEDANAAWASRFAPDERVAIKVNTIRGSNFWTHIPLVMAVAQRLQEVGIPAEQIVIFDRATSELEATGYPVNRDGPGVRCYGTDFSYEAGWTIMDTDVRLSPILLECDALINIPILKQHSIAGISFAMKNHYGTFDRPGSFHGSRMAWGMAELNALPPIRDRTRLVIGDLLAVSTRDWYTGVTGDSILMSFDPVAHDTVGLALYSDIVTAEGRSAESAVHLASGWLANGAELGIGTNDSEKIELKEVILE